MARRLLFVVDVSVGLKIKGLLWRGEEAARPAAVPGAAPVAVGDIKVEQVLVAFESMQAAMPTAQLAIAITATASAIGADPKQIADVLGKRLTAIDASITGERRRCSDRSTARSAELEAATAKARAEIEAMKQRIAQLEQQLAAATNQVHQQNANDQTQAVTFEQRARAEAQRLTALRDFLARTR